MKRILCGLTIAATFLLASAPAGAGDPEPAARIAPARHLAQSLGLAIHPEWLNLVHYEKEWRGWESQIDDPAFFNAPDGKTSPEAELLATISAVLGPAPDDDEHPACRFPARAEWLQRQLGPAVFARPELRCALYREWRAQVPDQRLSLIFPAYHLNSPSSMFGHTLLRLDAADVAARSDWLSVAVNFGADVRAEDNSILYAFKGLAGGYPGFFITSPYFTKIREYNQDEKRDIWEYRLNLTPDEIRFMVTHLWELKAIRFDYYFFDENCSYRLLELIEVARPGVDLTSEFQVTAIPVDTVRAMARAGLIDEAAHRPSQVTALERLLDGIPANLHGAIRRIAERPETMGDDEIRSLTPALQRRLADASYRFLRYDRGDGPRDAGVARRSYRLLEILNTFPAGEPPGAQTVPPRPETGHGSRRLLAGAGSEDRRAYADLGFRMSFHSLEDDASGFLPGAQINIGNVEMRVREGGEAALQRLDLVDIFSMTARSELFTPWSWRVIAGLERQRVGGHDVLAGQVSGGGGVALAPLRNNLSYLLATARLEANRRFAHDIEPALGVQAGTLQHFSASTAHLQWALDAFANGETRRRVGVVQTFHLRPGHAFQLTLARHDHEGRRWSDGRLAYLHYLR